jgi:hypothetical protein
MFWAKAPKILQPFIPGLKAGVSDQSTTRCYNNSNTHDACAFEILELRFICSSDFWIW